MRALVLRGGPWSADERAAILDYCAADVAALARLLPAMPPHIDLPRALLRGRYMAAAARMERDRRADRRPDARAGCGSNWDAIKDRLIAEIDADYGVFEGRTFKLTAVRAWLYRNRMPWPRLSAAGLI